MNNNTSLYNEKKVLRVILSFNSIIEADLYLRKLSDDEFVASDINESIELWLSYNNDINYTRLFNYIRDRIYAYMNESVNNRIHYVSSPYKHKLNKETGQIEIVYSYDNRLDKNTRYERIDSLCRALAWSISETIIDYIFKKECKNIISEPNGRNECPDKLLLFNNGDNAFVEVKSVLCGFYSDGKFHGKVNNAMKGIDLVLKDFRNEGVKANKYGTSLRNITTVFFFYFINQETASIHYFKTFVVPAPLAVDCEFNKDGTFKKLGQKSDNNFNTVLSLKVRSPYNKYNTLFDRAKLIATGKTNKGLNYMISNEEGKYYEYKDKFKYTYDNLIESLLNNTNDLEHILSIFNTLKLYKYNTNKYATKEDKDFIKDSIKNVKIMINKQFGKGTVR